MLKIVHMIAERSGNSAPAVFVVALILVLIVLDRLLYYIAVAVRGWPGEEIQEEPETAIELTDDDD